MKKTAKKSNKFNANYMLASTAATLGAAYLALVGYTGYLNNRQNTANAYQDQTAISALEDPSNQEKERKNQSKLEETANEEITQESEQPIQNNSIKPTTTNEQTYLAKALYGEARGQLETDLEYVNGVAITIKNRANRSGKTIEEITQEKNQKKLKSGKIIDVYQYTCFDPKDPNHKKIENPDKDLWQKCYEIAGQALQSKQDIQYTNYYVGADASKNLTKAEAIKSNIPGWAYQMKNGRFTIKDGKRIARTPAKTIKLSNGRTAYFYNFKQF